MKNKLWSMTLVFAALMEISACAGIYTQADQIQTDTVQTGKIQTDTVQTDQIQTDPVQRQAVQEQRIQDHAERKYQPAADQAQKTDGYLMKERKSLTQQTTSGKKNWMLNAGFEKNDISMWKLSYQGESNPTQIQSLEADAKSGVNSLLFSGKKKQNFKISQTVSGLAKGTYTASVYIQGKDTGRFSKIYLYAVIDGKVRRSKSVKLTGWGNWRQLKIKRLQADGTSDLTIGIKVKCADGGQGTIDDFALIRVD